MLGKNGGVAFVPWRTDIRWWNCGWKEQRRGASGAYFPFYFWYARICVSGVTCLRACFCTIYDCVCVRARTCVCVCVCAHVCVCVCVYVCVCVSKAEICWSINSGGWGGGRGEPGKMGTFWPRECGHFGPKESGQPRTQRTWVPRDPEKAGALRSREGVHLGTQRRWAPWDPEKVGTWGPRKSGHLRTQRWAPWDPEKVGTLGPRKGGHLRTQRSWPTVRTRKKCDPGADHYFAGRLGQTCYNLLDSQ